MEENKVIISTSMPSLRQGKQGIQGLKGDKGDTGEKGEKGSVELSALTPEEKLELTGEQGDKGDTGNDGKDGSKGDKGDKGEKGEKGDKGDRGVQGEMGAGAVDGITSTTVEEEGREEGSIMKITDVTVAPLAGSEDNLVAFAVNGMMDFSNTHCYNLSLLPHVIAPKSMMVDLSKPVKKSVTMMMPWGEEETKEVAEIAVDMSTLSPRERSEYTPDNLKQFQWLTYFTYTTEADKAKPNYQPGNPHGMRRDPKLQWVTSIAWDFSDEANPKIHCSAIGAGNMLTTYQVSDGMNFPGGRRWESWTTLTSRPPTSDEVAFIADLEALPKPPTHHVSTVEPTPADGNDGDFWWIEE